MRDLDALAARLHEVLQESDEDRILDSLEMVVVKSMLSAEGASLPDGVLPEVSSIKGWLRRLQQYTTAG